MKIQKIMEALATRVCRNVYGKAFLAAMALAFLPLISQAQALSTYTPLPSACRVVDTRQTGAVPANTYVLNIPLTASLARPGMAYPGGFAGRCGVLDDAHTAVALSITVLPNGHSGHLKLYRPGFEITGSTTNSSSLPASNNPSSTSTIVYAASGPGVASDVIVPTKAEGIFGSLPGIAAFGGGTVNYIIDVVGYFSGPDGFYTSAAVPIANGQTITAKSEDPVHPVVAGEVLARVCPMSDGSPVPGVIRSSTPVRGQGGCVPVSGAEHLQLVASVPLSGGGHQCTYRATGPASFAITGACKTIRK